MLFHSFLQMPSGGGTEFRTFSFGQSSSSSFSSHPDGSTEERKTTKDSQGNTKTTVRSVDCFPIILKYKHVIDGSSITPTTKMLFSDVAWATSVRF